MTLSGRILVGLLLGIAAGICLGEHAAPAGYLADAFVKLLQMTVLPYVTISIISSLGAMDADGARRLGLRMGAVLGVIWILALALALLLPLAFPPVSSASFFSTSLLVERQPFDFVSLYIPANPFNALANSIVPAVVLFSLLIGVALIGVPHKRVLLETLAVAGDAVSRATRFIVSLTPYGIFFIAASAAGTLTIEEISRIQVYLAMYVAAAIAMSLWVLPGLVAALTPIPARAVLARCRPALLTAFAAGDLFIVLPSLIDASRELLATYVPGDERVRGLPDTVVPASFTFPHAGKLLSLSFVLFAGWFADAPVSASQYPALALSGFLTFFGSLNAAVPFLLDSFRIPADTYQLFLATGVVNSRMGSLVAAVHTVTVALLGSCAVAGVLTLTARRLARYVVTTVILSALLLGGGRLVFSTALPVRYDTGSVLLDLEVLAAVERVRVVDLQAATTEPSGPAAPVIDRIRSRGALRVGVIEGRLPYAFRNRHGRFAGLDVELAHHLARDLHVGLDLVMLQVDDIGPSLEAGVIDLVTSGLVITPDRAAEWYLSDAYMEETLGFLVPDHARDRFLRWTDLQQASGLRVLTLDLEYFADQLTVRLPGAQFEVARAEAALFENGLGGADALAVPAERGSAITLLYPEYTVVVPQPGLIRMPLTYPLVRDERWREYVNTWLRLKKGDGTIDRLYQRWILGRQAPGHTRRWSVVQDVFGW